MATTKTRSLKDIQSEIAKLEAQAADLKAKEKGEVLPRIREAIAVYGFTAADLFGKAGAPKALNGSKPATKGRSLRAKSAKKKAGKLYRNPDTGAEWTGHGRRPAWVIAALEAGKTVEDFRVK